MSPRFQKKAARYLTFPDLSDAYRDFILSRQASRCTQATLNIYKHNLTGFLVWAEEQGCTCCDDLTPIRVIRYLAHLEEQGKADTTQHSAARTIKTFLRFLFKLKVIREPVEFDMPRLQKKRLPVLNAEQLRQIIYACDNPRDKAIVLLQADTGLRNSETCKLNWGDLNWDNGLIRVKQGKGQKDRSVVCGAVTRRALLAYRRTIKNHTDEAPLFQANYNYRNQRMGRTGLLLVYRRLTEKTGIHVTPHAMRRTFVILSLRRNMDVGIIQAMLGHSDLSMVYYYAQLEDDDLIRGHGQSGPVDNLF